MTKSVTELLRQFNDRFGGYLELTQFDDIIREMVLNISLLYQVRRLLLQKDLIEHLRQQCGNTFIEREPINGLINCMIRCITLTKPKDVNKSRGSGMEHVIWSKFFRVSITKV